MLAIFMPGPMELLIIGIIAIIVLVPVAVVVVLIVWLTRHNKSSGTNPTMKPCPNCNRFVSLHAATCPQCRAPLQTQQ